METRVPEPQNLYRDTVLEHGRHPRNFGRLGQPHRVGEGFNPLCGDRIQVFLRMDRKIDALTFSGQACAICLASGSMMTEALTGHKCEQAREWCRDFLKYIGPTSAGEPLLLNYYSQLRALLPVRRYPARIKCATLPWRAFEALLNQKQTIVTSE